MSDNSTTPSAGRPRAMSLLLRTVLVILFGCGVIAAYSLGKDNRRSSAALSTTINIPLEPFNMTDRTGVKVSSETLRGTTWIADFIFTHCAGPCPLMTRHMRSLQDELGDLEDVKLVSFTVDPQRDTLSVLAEYADRHGADPTSWHFLRGSLDAVYDLAIDGFRITVEQAREDNTIIHDPRFILVDACGSIRGYYDSSDPEELKRLSSDVRQLYGTKCAQ